MSATKQELESSFASDQTFGEQEFSQYEVEHISPAVGACVCAFSLPPFSEPWSINGNEVTGLLLNPCTAGELVKKVLNPELARISKRPDFKEDALVKKEVILGHINDTLANSMTNYLCSPDLSWISKKEISQLKKMQRELELSSEKFCKLGFAYPITMLFETYLETSRLPRSMLLLGYQKGPVFNEDAPIELINLNDGDEMPKGAFLRIGGRFLSVNHPAVEEKLSAADLAIKETRYYLNEEEQMELRDEIDADSYSIFLGEVAKIPDNDRKLKAVDSAGLKYLEVLIKPSEKNPDLPVREYIPKQIMYMSLPGTAVASDSHIEKGKSWTYQSLKPLWEYFGIKCEEKIKRFSKPNGEVVLFGIIKQV